MKENIIKYLTKVSEEYEKAKKQGYDISNSKDLNRWIQDKYGSEYAYRKAMNIDPYKGSDNIFDLSNIDILGGRKDQYDVQKETYQDYQDAKNLYASNMTDAEVIDKLNAYGLITTKEAGDYKDLLKTGDTKFNKHGFSRWLEERKGKTTKYAEMYTRLQEMLPYVEQGIYDPDKIKDALSGSGAAASVPVPDIADAPAPAYLNPNFDYDTIEVDPVHLWSNPELAELHNINYDMNHYYDLIKQGTEANVNLGRYKGEQLNQTSMVDDTKRRADYLGALRDNKLQAIANGLAIGSRRANEILQLSDDIQDYVNNQSNVFQQRYNAVDDYLRADAEARLTARQYFDTLAQKLSTDSGTLYSNDAERQAGQYAAQANMANADAGLLAAIYEANGAMAGSYAQAQANVDAARSGISTAAGNGTKEDELGKLYDIYLTSYGYDRTKPYTDLSNIDAVYKTNSDMDRYIRSRYLTDSGYTDYSTAYKATQGK